MTEAGRCRLQASPRLMIRQASIIGYSGPLDAKLLGRCDGRPIGGVNTGAFFFFVRVDYNAIGDGCRCKAVTNVTVKSAQKIRNLYKVFTEGKNGVVLT